MDLGSIARNPVHLLAFGLGAGTVPIAPGTVGTLLGIPLYLVLEPLGWGFYSMVTIVLVVAGVWLCARTSSDLGVRDHPGIVWDEITGFLVAMLGTPPDLRWILAGFVLFRFFDVLKPWPINWVDGRVPGGLGIVLDDVLAGLYAALSLQMGIRLLGD